MNWSFAATGLGIIITLSLSFQYYRKIRALNEIASNLIELDEGMRNTLLIGLYNRFKDGGETKGQPREFVKFVARLLERFSEGIANVTSASGDYGVDVEYTKGGHLLLGQVKCLAEDKKVDYEPVAIIHSQMLKQNAGGGFVVTTSDFTPNAIKYAQGLNIELVNGRRLIEIWVKALEREKAMTERKTRKVESQTAYSFSDTVGTN